MGSDRRTRAHDASRVVVESHEVNLFIFLCVSPDVFSRSRAREVLAIVKRASLRILGIARPIHFDSFRFISIRVKFRGERRNDR